MNSFFALHQNNTSSNRSSWIAFFVFLICLGFSFVGNAQSKNYLQAVEQLGYERTDLNDLTVISQYTDAHNNLQHIYVQQNYQGIKIKDAITGFHLDKTGQLIHLGNRFQKKMSSRIESNLKIDATKALQIALSKVEPNTNYQPKIIEQEKQASQKTSFPKAHFAQENMLAELVYLPTNSGNIILTWEVQIYTSDAQHYWMIYVDAEHAKILQQEDLVISCSFEHQHDDQCAASANNIHQHNHNCSSTAHAIHHNHQEEGNEVSMDFNGNFYRVYDAPIETPNHGDRTYVFTNGDPVASPYGWHYDGTAQYVVTKGNNVYAYEDQSGANAGLPAIGGAIPGQPLNFDFPLDLSQAPSTYTNAAVTNLFYWNNLIHDIFYHYGFTESAGNFQTDNLGKGGLGNDAVMAEAQDGGGTNNANFLTLPDGAPGRMQMYLWSSSTPDELVHIENSSSYPNGGVSFTAIPAAFGPDITTDGEIAPLVLLEANSNSSSTCSPCGCGTGQGVGLPPNNDVNGKIALIQRGDCSFIEKVMGAQAGGAVGVIVYNHTPGAGAIAMGGDETGNTILIPSVMVSFEDGQELLDEINAGTISIALRRDTPASPMKDGDLDNGIIAHEYGHGISIRLTGGPNATCLGGDEQAGEGWSDFFAYMTTMDAATLADGGYNGRGIGTYVFDQPTDGLGIRPAKYSRDFSVNSYTYGNINNTEITVPHGVGFIFSTALWEMAWALIDEYGYDPNLTSGNLNAGNILAIQLVMDGLKLQPCNPTFLDSRDAILAADQALTGGINQCIIWEAFAKRGMGFSAIAGTNSRGDEIEAFDLPTTCSAQLSMTKTADYSMIANGNTLTYTLTLSNTGNQIAEQVNISDPIPAHTTYVQGSASNGGFKVGNTIKFPSVNVQPGQTITRSFQVQVNTPIASTIEFLDDMEDGQSNWNNPIGANSWTLQNSQSNSGQFAWFANNPDNVSNQTLTLANPISLSANAELQFTHQYNTEKGFDGGLVEISNDGGTTWYDLGPHMVQAGYSDFIPLANNPLINGFAFGGNSNGFVTTKVNLALFQNQNVLIRFRFASDVATAADGWYIDDVVIGQDLTTISNTAFFSSSQASGQASVDVLVTNNTNQTSLQQVPNTFETTISNPKPSIELLAFPNPASSFVNVQLETAMEGEVLLECRNLHGQLIDSKTIYLEEQNTIQWNTEHLPDGMYTISAKHQTTFGATKIMIQRN